MNPPTVPTPRIMIVDDTAENLQLLEAFLRNLQYQVFALPSGEMALRAAAKEKPDLILLDIVMPGLSGYEVCQRLKADPVLAEIPIIFLSALDEAWDKVRAFEVGGVDYVTKPIQVEEVRMRILTHLELSRQRNELRAHVEKLQELERLREDLTHMIIHDLRSPLAVVELNLELIKSVLDTRDPEILEPLADATSHARRLAEMISQLLDVGRLESGRMPLTFAECDLLDVVQSVQKSVAGLGGGRPINLTQSGSTTSQCDSELVSRVLGNLLINAFKFTPEGGTVDLSVEGSEDAVRVRVSDRGKGVPAELQRAIFEKFGQASRRAGRPGFGVGLAFCRLAIEAHGGQIGVQSEVGKGSTFWFSIPRKCLPSTATPTPVGQTGTAG
ncbi:MAG: hybrid sensor histidine kinase/response regulator [Verrucomicrobiales bacterium]|nr:hybrid sensor histidine kinase/response regulator [Verrucomicrobiales bacterium]